MIALAPTQWSRQHDKWVEELCEIINNPKWRESPELLKRVEYLRYRLERAEF